MAISERQLEIWANPGAGVGSRDTYAAVRTALEDSRRPYANHDVRIFLQGSYGNDTNIYSESDVDVVIELKDSFFHDLRELPDEERRAFERIHSDAPYDSNTWKADVVRQLTTAFGADVKPGLKAIKIQARGNRRSADVIVAHLYKIYSRFRSLDDETFETGICFFTTDGEQIINYPKQHSDNCTTKHQATNSWFKPMVRVFKNIRTKLVEDGAIEKGCAPSYYVEGLLYNVPNRHFGISRQQTFINAVTWLLEADRDKLVCANEEYFLLRGPAHVTWSADNCAQFLEATTELWERS